MIQWPHYISNAKKILIVATGGGSDIVSGTAIAKTLPFAQTDVMGMLSPASIHTYDGKPAQPIQKLSGKKSERFICYVDEKLPIRFIDPVFAKNNPNITFYHSCMNFGMLELKKAFQEFVSENGYDLVLGVDVGGDILATPKTPVVSPMMDLSVLNLLTSLKEIPVYLIEYGLGSDGELEYYDALHILNDLKMQAIQYSIVLPLQFADLYENEFKKISNIRTGNTVQNTCTAIRWLHNGPHSKKDFFFNIRFSRKIMETTFTKSMFDHKAVWESLGMLYIINPNKLIQLQNRKSLLMDYETPLQYFAMFKNIFSPPWSTEMDLQPLQFKNGTVVYLFPLHEVDNCRAIPTTSVMISKAMDVFSKGKVHGILFTTPACLEKPSVLLYRNKKSSEKDFDEIKNIFPIDLEYNNFDLLEELKEYYQ